MARTEAQDVAKILPGNPNVDDLEVHVTDAHVQVNEELPTEDLAEDQLEIIERYFAAHSYKFLTDRQLMQFAQGGSSGMFTGLYRQGLQGTSYGQMAIAADPTGTLAERSRPNASIEILDSRGN